MASKYLGQPELVVFGGYFSVSRIDPQDFATVGLLERTLSDLQEGVLQLSGTKPLVPLLDWDEPELNAAWGLAPRLARRFSM